MKIICVVYNIRRIFKYKKKTNTKKTVKYLNIQNLT